MSGLLDPYRFGGGAAPTDPHWANVVLLSGFEGSDGQTTFTDESSFARSLTTHGGCEVDTAAKKYGVSAAIMDGSGDGISAAQSTDFDFGAGDFTIEAWLYWTNVAGGSQRDILTKWGGSGSRGWQFLWNVGATPDLLQFIISTSGSNSTTVLSNAWTPTISTWYHVCAERAGNTWRSYIDGVMLGKATNSGTIFANNQATRIGGTLSNTFTWAGSMDEMRVTKGVARYASDAGFTPPASAFPRTG